MFSCIIAKRLGFEDLLNLQVTRLCSNVVSTLKTSQAMTSFLSSSLTIYGVTNVGRSLHSFFTLMISSLKGAVSYFTHIFFSFFLVFLQTSNGFSLIKTYKLHYFYLILYSETTDRGEITVTTTFTSGLDLCIFPCFKDIVYQINSFAPIAK